MNIISTYGWSLIGCLLTVTLSGNTVGADAPTSQNDETLISRVDSTPSYSSLQLQGIVVPKRHAILRFHIIGEIAEIHAREGDVVQAGKPLISLDSRVQEAEVATARAAAQARGPLRQAEIEVEQLRSILERTLRAQSVNASAQFEVDAKRNQMRAAEAAVDQQRETITQAEAQLQRSIALLDQMTLSAPIDGQVVRVRVKLGNTVDTTEEIVEVADLSELQTELHLPSELFGTVSVGESKSLRAGKPVGGFVNATVDYVSPVIEPTSGTFMVKLSIENPGQSLPSGFEVWYQ